MCVRHCFHKICRTTYSYHCSNDMRFFLLLFNLKISITFDVFFCFEYLILNWKWIFSIFHWFVMKLFCWFLHFFLKGNFRELIEYLNGTSDLLAKNGNILDNVLETLDVQQHSLGVLYVLVAKFTNLTVSLMWFS